MIHLAGLRPAAAPVPSRASCQNVQGMSKKGGFDPQDCRQTSTQQVLTGEPAHGSRQKECCHGLDHLIDSLPRHQYSARHVLPALD